MTRYCLRTLFWFFRPSWIWVKEQGKEGTQFLRTDSWEVVSVQLKQKYVQSLEYLLTCWDYINTRNNTVHLPELSIFFHDKWSKNIIFIWKQRFYGARCKKYNLKNVYFWHYKDLNFPPVFCHWRSKFILCLQK